MNTAITTSTSAPALETISDDLLTAASRLYRQALALQDEVRHIAGRAVAMMSAADAERVAPAPLTPAATIAARMATNHEQLALRGPFAAPQNGEGLEADLALWAAAPVQCVPGCGQFKPLPADAPAHRFLVARSGLWLECRRPWLHLIWPVAPLAAGMEAVSLPYGDLSCVVDVVFGKVPHHFLREIADHGRNHLPNEIGGWLSWKTDARTDVIAELPDCVQWSEPCFALGTPGKLVYNVPEASEHETPCVDIHTHGTAPAFFSEIDDADDRGAVKIAIVIGNLDQPVPSIAARLCCLGVTIPIAVDAEEVFGGAS